MPYKDREVKLARDRARYHDNKKLVDRTGPKFKAPPERPQLQLPVVPDFEASEHGLRIATLMDVQAKPGVSFEHLDWYGRYIADKQPDVIVCIGDFSDLPSLSSYDKGTGRMEGKRYRKDVEATHEAMETFLNPIRKASGYNPAMILTEGNHEYRIERAIKDDPVEREGVMHIDQLKYKEYGWTVIPFLMPVVIGGVSFCHYFPTGVMGKPITSARALLTKLHMSAVAGHQQGRDIAFAKRADGKDMTAIISGSFYTHHEEYLNRFVNSTHWRGTWFLHQVKDGQFDEMALSIDFLKRRYGSAKK